MVSLPPMTPGTPSRVEPEAVEKHKGSVPEAVRYMLAAWAVMIGGELLHQNFRRRGERDRPVRAA